MYCLKCKQQWKQERLQAVQTEARRIANETGITQAITKEGCIYKIVKANEATNAIEYIAADFPQNT